MGYGANGSKAKCVLVTSYVATGRFRSGCKGLPCFTRAVERLVRLRGARTPHKMDRTSWRGGRAADCTGLENRHGESHRGFESLPLRSRGASHVTLARPRD